MLRDVQTVKTNCKGWFEKNEIVGACGSYGGEERCIPDFGEET